MARADLLLSIIRSGSQGNQADFRRAVESLIAEERARQHHVLADQLAENLKIAERGGGPSPSGLGVIRPAIADEKLRDLLIETVPRRRLDDLVLPDAVLQVCEELVEEHSRIDVLRSHGLEPRHRLLLCGPPGNGKTSLAEALAERLAVPLLTLRYDSLMGSLLGETAGRLRKVFDHVRTRPCVLFFDEFETLGKERGDTHETGEVKRVVSSLLLQIDQLPSYVVVIGASNHPELLDRAVWRRFQVRLELPSPTRAQLERLFARFEARLGKKLGLTPRTLAEKLRGSNFAEAEAFCADILRRYALSLEQGNLPEIVRSRIAQWQARLTPPPVPPKD